ncbi:MAG TPA: HAD family hydrolase [Methanophagales archaeon]|nr:HAD family hydrolase [Methanophagales archaeon]
MVNRYKTVIFDMDETLLNSRGVKAIAHEWAYEAFRKTLRYYGISLTMKEIDSLFLAPLHSDGEEGVRQFCNRFGLDIDDFWARREADVIEAKIEAMQTGEIKLCAGSEEIILYLSGRFYLAVVSDSQQACVDYALEHFHLKPHFKIWYGRSSDLVSLAKRKPSPYYIKKVLSELNMDREDAILVDDSPVGILAANRAGIDSVLIGNDDKGLKYESEPTFFVHNIGELKSVI